MLEIFYNPFGCNTDLFVLLNNYLNIGVLPNILQLISSVFFISNFAMGYCVACAYFYYKAKKSDNPALYFEQIYYEMIRIGICYALFGLVFAALKFSINLPRPFCSLPPHLFTTIADTSLERCLSSFPSAHTGLSLLVAYCFWPYINKPLKILTYFTVLAVALSRIALAMHYPSDIIYSAIITIFIIAAANYINKKCLTIIITPVQKIISGLFFT
ncbi:MAG: phosphatase PAP2 family protein [Rickettsiaceae bacterium]|nr:phosphatase PAP2 family protein [Rickettsiaceae bacterium]